MTEQLPDWLAIPAIAILSIAALYHFYILPGYNRDALEASETTE